MSRSCRRQCQQWYSSCGQFGKHGDEFEKTNFTQVFHMHDCHRKTFGCRKDAFFCLPVTKLNVRVCVCQRKTKDRADGMREKVPIPLDGIRTCTSGIRAHRASDYTTRAGTPRVSRNKHIRHSSASSIVKQS